MTTLGGLSLKSMNLMASVPEAKDEDLVKEDHSFHSGHDEEALTTKEESTSEIAGKENRMVKYSKALVLLVIVAVASTIGTATYAFVRHQEQKTYKRSVSIWLLLLSSISGRLSLT